MSASAAAPAFLGAKIKFIEIDSGSVLIQINVQTTLTLQLLQISLDTLHNWRDGEHWLTQLVFFSF